MSSFVPRPPRVVHISLRHEHTFDSVTVTNLPRSRCEGEGAGSYGLPGKDQGTGTGPRPARPEPHPRRHRRDPRRLEVVGVALGPRRPVHALPAAPGPAATTPAAARSKLLEMEDLNRESAGRLGQLDEQAFLAAGVALYAGEGSKADGEVNFANSDPEMVRFFCAWLRRFFQIDESRLRVRVYLHQGLDLEMAEHYWSQLTCVPRSQFRKGYRAVPDPSIRRNKHANGCVYVRYTCTRTHRRIMGMVRALLSSSSYSGVAQ